MLTFHDVGFQYRGKKALFEGFDLQFKPGKTLVLGPNGAGKSTLFHLAVGREKPRAGQVETAGLSVSLMPQHIPIFRSLSVREQVAYNAWLAGISEKDAWHLSSTCLEMVNLSEFADRSPNKISGGQLRRMGVASALATGSRVLLLDEPTAGLDLDQVAGFYQQLASLPGLHSIIVSSHQIEGIGDFYDHVVVINEGRVNFEGTFSEFVSVGYIDGTRSQGEALVNAFRKFTGKADQL